MKVIGAGLPRTGTMSLKIALDMLGFGPCYHMREVSAPGNTGHVELWRRAARGDAIDWAALLRGYRATVDIPGAAFYRELLTRYPRARVVLTVRDRTRWYASVRDTIHRLRAIGAPETAAFDAMVDDVFWLRTLHGRFADAAYATAAFDRHADAVRAHVPARQLLVFDACQGWEPLCTFLDVPEPAVPFPHANDGAIFSDYLDVRSALARASEDDVERTLHERMVALERQLLDEIRAAHAVPER